MALLGLQVALLAVVAIALHAACAEPISVCSVPDSGAATVCNMDSDDSCQGENLTGDIFLIGTGASTWDVRGRAFSFANDSRVTVSCLRIPLEQHSPEWMKPDNLSMLLSPPFLRSSSGAPLASLTMHDVELTLSCDLLREWQQFLCSVQLPGRTLVQDHVISIVSWTAGDATLKRVNLTCVPADIPFAPVCSMAVVDVVSDILEASSRLQDPYLPLVLLASRDLSFTSSHWPESGLRITANVTLSATLGSNVTISFGLRTVLFTVDTNSSTAFLSFRGCILLDLPLSYLPLSHPRRPFGVLSTALWPVYREEVAMGLYDSTLILTQEEFKFWSFWLTILTSPMPGVSAKGNWTYANAVQLGQSGDDYIHLLHYRGRYTTLINVRYQVTNELYVTQQRNNILQITNDEQVPPTVVFQIRDSEDLLNALLSPPSESAKQYGHYIILTGNLTMDDSTSWPRNGAPVRYPTTITTWPSSWVAFDLRGLQDAFYIMPVSSSSVVMRNIVLVNLAPGPKDSDYEGQATGLWAFNFTKWRVSDQQRISLEQAVMVVSREEVRYYIEAAVTKQMADTWISSFQVDSYDTVNRSWIQFSALATSRFTAQALNITDTVPDIFDSALMNITAVPGLGRASRMVESPSDSRREVLLFALLAITLPASVGAVLLTYIIMKRRRLSRLCQPKDGKAVQPSDAGAAEDGWDGAEHEGKPPRPEDMPSCCLPLPLALQLRKAKFINPLYHDAERAPPGIVLTGVLGPAALARAMVPIPAQGDAMLMSGMSVCTDASDPSGDALPMEAAAQESVAGRLSGGSAISRSPRSLSLPPAELQRGEELSGVDATAKDSSAVPAAAPGGPALGCDAGCRVSSGSQAAGAAAAVRSAAGAWYGQGNGAQRSGIQPSNLQISPSASGEETATAPSVLGPAAAPGSGAAASASAESLAMLARQIESRVAHPAPRHPRFMDVQQLDRLRREIGDRHLEVLHSLGWGGCGVVYKGIWKGLQVAVKTILLQGDSKQSEQFLTEAAISASLQHANIVTTFLYELRPLDEVDPGTGSVEIHIRSTSSDGTLPADADRMNCWKLYIVQEYCELGTLKAAIDQGYFKASGVSLPNLAFLLIIALDVALGLAHVHSKNVVHGDVTVSNVLLQACPSRPQGCIAKLADFGLSVKFEAGQSQGYHLYGGTPHYMAPERVRGVLSKQSDIYSLGVCFWELYCGTPPWRRSAAGPHHHDYGGGNSSSSVDSGGAGSGHHHHHHHHARFGDSAAGHSGTESVRFPRGCPPEYSSLVNACLSTDPHARPTALAVVSVLERLHRRYC